MNLRFSSYAPCLSLLSGALSRFVWTFIDVWSLNFELFERAKQQNDMDHERALKDFDREEFLKKERKKQVF